MKRRPEVKETRRTVEIVTKEVDFGGFKVVYEKNGDAAADLTLSRTDGEVLRWYTAKLLESEVLVWGKKIGWGAVSAGSSGMSRSVSLDIKKKVNSLKDSFYDESVTAEQTFDAIVDGPPPGKELVFISQWNGSYYIPGEEKNYKTYYLDYIEADLTNRDYDLEKVLTHLKALPEDSGVFFVNDQIQMIPSYNGGYGRTHYISFYFFSDSIPGNSGRDGLKVVKERLGLEEYRIVRDEKEDDDEDDL